MREYRVERELWLQADAASVSVARAFVGQVADELDYDPAARAELRLAAGEAVANAVEHGAPCEGGLIGVSTYLESGSLTTEVSDCGDFQEIRRSSNDRERGRGLQLMFAVVDHVEIDTVPGRTVVRLAKRLPR
jgi:anti-sigma regulatory factor (Ser/Thr protein kinase)